MCRDVRIEPILNKLTGGRFEQRTVNTLDEARLDVAARGFWAASQLAFFEIIFFYPNATRYAKVPNNVMRRTRIKRKESITTE